MSLLGWVFFLLIGHMAMYFFLGTMHWFETALLATAVWAAVLYGGRYVLRRRQRERI